MKLLAPKAIANFGNFRLESDDALRFYSANVLKTAMFQLAFVFFVIDLFTISWGHFTDPNSLEILLGSTYESREVQAFYLLFLNPIFPFIIGLIAPSVRVYFDRASGVVRYKMGRLAFTLPWSQVTFAHQWFPTKTGGATLFTLVVVPPFPANLERIFEKKRKKTLHAPGGQSPVYKLGSFDVKGPEHGQAIYRFLDAWMRSREPADALYRSLVSSRFEG